MEGGEFIDAVLQVFENLVGGSKSTQRNDDSIHHLDCLTLVLRAPLSITKKSVGTLDIPVQGGYVRLQSILPYAISRSSKGESRLGYFEQLFHLCDPLLRRPIWYSGAMIDNGTQHALGEGKAGICVQFNRGPRKESGARVMGLLRVLANERLVLGVLQELGGYTRVLGEVGFALATRSAAWGG
jgi:hypothetical protein